MKEGSYSDTIVAKITDNPEPVEFAIAAIGSLPKVLGQDERGGEAEL